MGDVRTQVRISTSEEEVCDVECWRPETETRLEQTGVRSVLTWHCPLLQITSNKLRGSRHQRQPNQLARTRHKSSTKYGSICQWMKSVVVLESCFQMMSLDLTKDQKNVGKTKSVDICLQRSQHAPLERQMCLQIPEERPFLRRQVTLLLKLYTPCWC